MEGFNCADWEVHLSDEATTMSLRGPVPTPTIEAVRPSLMGRKGWTGWTGYQKGPLILFIFCGYIEKGIYLLIYEKKVVTNILMGFKISCQVGGRVQKFQNYVMKVTFLFLVLKLFRFRGGNPNF